MRNPLRRSSLLLVGLLLATALLTSDVSAEPAGAATVSQRPAAQRSKASFRGRHSASLRRVNRARWRRTSRSAARPRPRARAVQAKAVQRAVQAKAVQRAVPTGDVWARLRRCESGGNYAINTGNGFYGAYQFHPRTWRGLGYPGLPHQAPPEMQDEAARKLQARSGWGQWPACSRRLGLRR